MLELPIPEEGESQADFAIRFHNEVGDAMPTDQRTAESFRIWRDVHGPDEEAVIARQRFPESEYDEVRDVAIFDEHDTPRDKYRRNDLIGIMDQQNSRIRSRQIFAPISDGHTSDDPKDPEPTVLGYVGTVRLGMVGNENPTWCLFSDEYHRKSKKDVLNAKRGRSVETYRFDAHNRFIPPSRRYFYPVAALGSVEPRLQLPPARYERSREDIERYAMPGGGNAMGMPSVGGMKNMQPQKYGDEDFNEDRDPLEGLGGSDRDIVLAILKALMESDVVQEQIAKAEMQSGMGSVGPRIPNVIEPAQAGQQPGAGMPPQQPGMPPQQGTPGVSGQAGAAPKPTGFGNSQPEKPQGDDEMSEKPEDKAKYSMTASAAEALEAANARIGTLEAALKTLTDELHNERTARITTARYSRIDSLASEYTLDVEKERARAAKMTDEQFEDHIGTIKECYRRKIEDVRDFSALGSKGKQTDEVETETNELGEVDVNEIVKYARQHNLGYEGARERYMAEKKQKATAG